MITKLMQNDVSPIHVAQLTGHKNLKSLDSYSKASVQQKKMSNLISETSGTSVALSNVTNSTATSFQGKINAIPSCNQSMLPGMQITGNSVVNVYFHQTSSQASQFNNSPSRKRHRAFLLESSDEEQ